MRSTGKRIARLISWILIVNLFAVHALADERFIDNPHWKEIPAQTVTQMHNKGESFVAMFFSSTCFNSNLRKVMADDWMTQYGHDVYGVDVDQYTIPSRVRAKLNGQVF